MNFDFGEVLTRAWQIIWKYKVLWIFGMLSSCGGGGNGSNNSNRFSGEGGGNELLQNNVTREIVRAIENFGAWLEQNPWAVFALIAFVLVAWFVQIALVNIGKIGLIRGAYRADSDAQAIRFGELWSESLTYFWRAIGLSLTVWGPVLVVLIGLALLFVLPIAVSETGGADAQALLATGMGLFVIAFCCCLFPVLVLLKLYYLQAERALLLEDLGVFESIRRGWEAFSANFLGLIIMGVVLFVINVILGIAIAVPVYIMVIPLVLQLAAGTVDTWTPILVTMGLLCAYAPVAWFLSGVVASYVQTVWTLVYVRAMGLPKKDADAPVFIESNA